MLEVCLGREERVRVEVYRGWFLEKVGKIILVLGNLNGLMVRVVFGVDFKEMFLKSWVVFKLGN